MNYRISEKLGLFFSALVVRIIYLIQTKDKIVSNFSSDSAMYDNWAREIATGAKSTAEAFYMGPLYPYFMAFFYNVPKGHTFTVLVAQAIISSISCLLLFFIAKKIFDRATALIAAGLFIFYPVLIFYDGCILSESLLIFLHLATVYSVLIAVENRNYGWWILVGILTGLAALGRANILLFTFLFLLVYAIVDKSKRKKTKARKHKRRSQREYQLGYSLLICIAATFLVILPVTIRNYSVSKDFVLITSNFGFNFYIGNNPNAPGEYETPKEVVLDSDLTGKLTAESQRGHSLKPSEVSEFWFSQAMKFAKNEPVPFLTLFMKKLLLFWNGYEIPQAENFYFSQRYSPLLRIPGMIFGVIAPLGLLGLIISFKNWRQVYSLYIFIISYMLSVAIFFVVSRFRIHVVPFLIIFGASGIYWLAKIIISKKVLHKRSILNLGLLVIFFVLVNLRVPGFNTNKAMSEGYNMQGIYHSYFYKDYDTAIALFNRALEHVPEGVETYNNLATTYLNMKDFEQAIEIYKKLTEMEPDRWIFYYNLGIAYYLSEQFKEAIEALETAVRLEPHSVHAPRILERAKKSISEGEN